MGMFQQSMKNKIDELEMHKEALQTRICEAKRQLDSIVIPEKSAI